VFKVLIKRKRSKNCFLTPSRSNKCHSSSKMIINKKPPTLTTNLASLKMLKDVKAKEVADKRH